MEDDGNLILSYEFDIRVGEQNGKAGMSYFQGDPYTVFLFIATKQGMVKWEFARDLLLGGGEGQVTVAHHKNIVTITLRGEDGKSAPIVFDKSAIDAFVRVIYNMVEAGEESKYIDIDGEYEELLAWEENDNE